MSRWAISSCFDPKGISAKTTRKSIESWIIAAGVSELQVCLRQGHDKITSTRHYLGLPFSPDEKEVIKKGYPGVYDFKNSRTFENEIYKSVIFLTERIFYSIEYLKE